MRATLIIDGVDFSSFVNKYVYSVEYIKREEEVSKNAGAIVGRIYDAFLARYANPENPATLESRQYENLYACGEVLDVDGPCGGFNLQWAFASARLCAACIAEKCP